MVVFVVVVVVVGVVVVGIVVVLVVVGGCDRYSVAAPCTLTPATRNSAYHA